MLLLQTCFICRVRRLILPSVPPPKETLEKCDRRWLQNIIYAELAYDSSPEWLRFLPWIQTLCITNQHSQALVSVIGDATTLPHLRCVKAHIPEDAATWLPFWHALAKRPGVERIVWYQTLHQDWLSLKIEDLPEFPHIRRFTTGHNCQRLPIVQEKMPNLVALTLRDHVTYLVLPSPTSFMDAKKALRHLDLDLAMVSGDTVATRATSGIGFEPRFLAFRNQYHEGMYTRLTNHILTPQGAASELHTLHLDMDSMNYRLVKAHVDESLMTRLIQGIAEYGRRIERLALLLPLLPAKTSPLFAALHELFTSKAPPLLHSLSVHSDLYANVSKDILRVPTLRSVLVQYLRQAPLKWLTYLKKQKSCLESFVLQHGYYVGKRYSKLGTPMLLSHVAEIISQAPVGLITLSIPHCRIKDHEDDQVALYKALAANTTLTRFDCRWRTFRPIDPEGDVPDALLSMLRRNRTLTYFCTWTDAFHHLWSEIGTERIPAVFRNEKKDGLDPMQMWLLHNRRHALERADMWMAYALTLRFLTANHQHLLRDSVQMLVPDVLSTYLRVRCYQPQSRPLAATSLANGAMYLAMRHHAASSSSSSSSSASGAGAVASKRRKRKRQGR